MPTRLTVPIVLVLSLASGGTSPAQDPQSKPAGGPPPVFHAPTPGTPAAAAYERFLARHSGKWWSEWSAATGTPNAIWGEGIPLADWRGSSLDEARRQAELLLREHADLLGLGASDFRESIGAGMGQTWVLVYDQYFHGLPVIGGRADVRIHGSGRVPLFGATAWPIPAAFPTVPRLGELEATRIAWSQVGFELVEVPQMGTPRQPRLVIWGDTLAHGPAPFALAWEIPISNIDAEGHGPRGRYYIDAGNGGVLHYTSDRADCGHVHGGSGQPLAGNGPAAATPPVATGTVMAWTRTGLSATSALVNVPVAGLEISVPGVGVVVTDANGNFSANITVPTNVTVDLNGIHTQLITGPSAPSITTTLQPGPNPVIQFVANATDAQAAHTTCYYWTHRTNEFVRSIVGSTPQMATIDTIAPRVNTANTCNAIYGGNAMDFFAAGGGCNNMAFSTIVAHEWGHGIDDQYGGWPNNIYDGLSEGWGDIVAMYLTDGPIIGQDVSGPGTSFRTGNNTTNYPPPQEVHAAGQVWMGFAWQLRQRMAQMYGSRATAIAITNAIVLGSVVANASNQVAAVREVFVADDNDGNLANGTPHAAELVWACTAKNLPQPLPLVPANDECLGAIPVVNGLNGPFGNLTALNSQPPWACGNGTKDVWFTCVTGTGTMTVSTCSTAGFDTMIEVFAGSCGALTSLGCNDDACNSLQSSVTVPVTAGQYYIRVGGYNGDNGSFSLNVSYPTGTPASYTNYGSGCGRTSRSAYEYFATASAFDLGGHAMRWTRAGDHYVVGAGGSFLFPPASATTLALGDDAEATVALPLAFSYPGGSTTVLHVCSNGFVSPSLGNGTAYVPNAGQWLASPLPRWGCWHDFDPTMAGSGQVKYHQSGSVACITWDGVYDHLWSLPNVWQLQFDLATGTVTYVFYFMANQGNGYLVGYTAAGPNVDLGSRDLTASLAAGFQTHGANNQPLALNGTVPRLGTALGLDTIQFPVGSNLGIQVMSLQQVFPGLELSSVGMPGCYQYVGNGVNSLLFPTGGQAHTTQAIPYTSALIGLPLDVQSFAFAPGLNAAGIVSSNALYLIVGV